MMSDERNAEFSSGRKNGALSANPINFSETCKIFYNCEGAKCLKTRLTFLLVLYFENLPSAKFYYIIPQR